MRPKDGSLVRADASKPVWRTPRLEELGNLRDFVQEGAANGKSGPTPDGGTSGNNEAGSPDRRP